MLALIGLTYEREITEPLIAIYEDALSDYTKQQIDAAAKRLIQTSKFFPRPAEFIAILDPAPSGNLDVVVSAGAWTEMVRYLQSTKKLGELEDRALEKTIRLFGGREVLANVDIKTLQYLRKDFQEVYLAFATPEQKRDRLVEAGATESMLRALPEVGNNAKQLKAGDK